MKFSSSVISDPDKIVDASNSLMSYADFLEEECLTFRSALHMLGERWQDEQFRDFQNHFSVVAGELERLITVMRDTKPKIDTVVENLRDFQADQNLPN